MDDFFSNFDSVVILANSSWKKGLRDHHYHYAVHFAKYLPVIVVQADLNRNKYILKPTGHENITLLHISKRFTEKQSNTLGMALSDLRITKPLLWVYNHDFYHFLASAWSPLVVFHAVFDYFSDASTVDDITSVQNSLRETLKYVSLLVCPSAGMEQSYKTVGKYAGASVIVTNGCDYNFFAEKVEPISEQSSKVVLYTGTIDERINFKLLSLIIQQLRDFTFLFCGKISNCEKEWATIRKEPNVKYLDIIDPDQLKKFMQNASVGLIPFTEDNYIIKSAFPKKTFEYLACGLPVVSVPFDALQEFKDVIEFASGVDQFVEKIKEAEADRGNLQLIRARMKKAQKQDYALKFASVIKVAKQKLLKGADSQTPFNILFLFDASCAHVATILENLRSFKQHSSNNIFYAAATGFLTCNLDLANFDVVVLHSSIKINAKHLSSSLAPSFERAVKNFRGYKVLFFQEEYENTNAAKESILDLGIHTVYNTASAEFLNDIYPDEKFQNVEFIQALTGYIPEYLKKLPGQPVDQRKFLIGYRGKELPYWYGNLGREELTIGKEMKRICTELKLSVDIEWEDHKQIYGDKWYEFLSDCRATLGTESGSSIFDFTGELSKQIKLELQSNPKLSYEEAHQKYLAEHEGKIKINQLSPKIFDAIALRTALILFEGNYSGVLKPHKHYLPLKKDFSNANEILEKISDDKFVNDLTQRCYDDIVQSERYSCHEFVYQFDTYLSKKLKSKVSNELTPIVYVSTKPRASQSFGRNLFAKKRFHSSLLSNDLVKQDHPLALVNSINSPFFKFRSSDSPTLLAQLIHLFLSSSFVELLKEIDKRLPGKPFRRFYRYLCTTLKFSI